MPGASDPKAFFVGPGRYSAAGAFITQFKKGQLKLEPGCNAEQSLEQQVTGVLNNIREAAAKVGVWAVGRVGPWAAGGAGEGRAARWVGLVYL